MLGRLFLLFTLVPIVEIYLLVTLGGLMGPGPTVALVAATGFLGAWLARREGRKALAAYQESMAKMELPEDGIVSGLLILAGGVMLITPGVMTDVFGLAMMVPPIRRATASLVKKRMQKRIASGDVQVMHIGAGGFRAGFGGGVGRGGDGGLGDGAVVDAEIVDAEGGAGSREA
ncbi:phage T7 F exclusion suppressor FxsA [Enhygromyxa salina]|uniref:Phage T7 F exclusion suppressor FxsA n=1 Tax=Enhygromyxa salina TaxID=215803 RepID=A0A2S9XBT6_9BACT|nr:FxsA family protein [Enhygromyxa salina]PRP90315.1 phage T7 F exclusion suppressor FxsA [Enhygromyxa salina]